MIIDRSGQALGLALALVLAGTPLALSSVGYSVSSDSANSQATVTYTVEAPSGKSVKDLHFEPGAPKSQNLKAPLSDPAPAVPTGWTAGSGTSDHQFVTTQGSGISGGTSGTFSFTFHTGGNFAKWAKTLKGVKVTLTDDGSDEIKPGVNVVQEGGPVTPGGGGGTGPQVDWPLSFVEWKEPGGSVVAAIGDVVAFRVETSHFGGQAFKLYVSTALSQTEAGPDNPLGVGIDTNEAIPVAWGLEITPAPGRSTLFTEVEDDLDTAIVTVAIPADVDLVGETFYLVAASDSDGDGLADLVSPPLRVTIQHQGSGSSGIEVLEYGF